ncbi:hypothetical protein [Mucilaginibacter sp. BT774]|uniref:hypothetical protein n=1 Tax=Mucilaginibacter sp. BT774 TaxID=3062276 RepID=UPI00267597EB|nr:hypothetical protein [Mucilaginibacter sp. BT774]MDO3627372.1 hypothetical protein [Mucilaginibacter sp. BT774]
MRILIFICSLFLSRHHSPENKTKIDVPIYPNIADTSKYVILKLNSIPGYIFDNSYKPAELSEGDITTIEKLIDKSVQKYNKRAKKYLLIKNLSGYYKQFIIVTNATGEKEVWANCFCDVFPQNFSWKKKILSVFDGGSCFFQLKINLTTKRIYDFSVNGVA